MSLVVVSFEAELPFWLCMDNKKYEISIDGKLYDAGGNPWKIDFSNDKIIVGH